MSRSVSCPSGALLKVYCDTSDPFYNDRELWIESFVEPLKSKYPSLTKCRDIWYGREDRIVLKNAVCYVGLSEYCGLTCLWVVAKEGKEQQAKFWTDSIHKSFAKFGDLRRVGTFSNGESVYEKVRI